MNQQEFKQHRLVLNMTQKQLAEELGITATSVYRIEKGLRNASVRLIRAFELLIDSKNG